MSDPIVTIIVPTFNEEAFIRGCLEGLLSQEIRVPFEVLVVDGNSEDATLTMVEEVSASCTRQDVSVRVIENPHRRTPFAFNLGIENARGDYVIILGAHTVIPPDWLQKSYDAICAEPEDVAMAGGAIENEIAPEGRGPFAEAIAYAMGTFWGGGVSEYRYSDKRSYVETAPYGIYRKPVLDELGGFDTDFAIGQDGELSARIRKAGYRILFDPEIRSRYFPRNTLRKLVKQMFLYGQARTRIIRKHGSPKIVHIFPMVFVCYAAATPVLMFANPLLLTPLGLYALVTLGYSLGRPSSLAQNFMSYATIHTMFGAGMMAGLFGRQ